MKTELSFLFILLFYSSAFSQPEFAPIGAEWYYSQYESHDPPQANYIKHACIKDSTINGESVRVIQKTKFTREGAVDLGYEYLCQHGDTISYWKSGEFHPLYNFSLSKGDSMLIYSEMPNYCIDKTSYGWIGVDSVFSVRVNNYELKAYFATHIEGSVWGFAGFPIIERIGSTLYIFPQNESCVVDIPGIGPLRCYSDPDLGTFFYESLPCDTITTFPDYSSKINNKHRFRLYPNPVADDLIIEYGDGRGGRFNMEMYDNKGDRVLKQAFYPGERIDLSKLIRGIYFIIITNNHKRYYNGVICKI